MQKTYIKARTHVVDKLTRLKGRSNSYTNNPVDILKAHDAKGSAVMEVPVDRLRRKDFKKKKNIAEEDLKSCRGE